MELSTKELKLFQPETFSDALVTYNLSMGQILLTGIIVISIIGIGFSIIHQFKRPNPTNIYTVAGCTFLLAIATMVAFMNG